MLTPDHLQALEDRLKAAGRSVASVCREAGVAQSTWLRWKTKGHVPRRTTERAILAAVDALAPVSKPVAPDDQINLDAA